MNDLSPEQYKAAALEAERYLHRIEVPGMIPFDARDKLNEYFQTIYRKREERRETLAAQREASRTLKRQAEESRILYLWDIK